MAVWASKVSLLGLKSWDDRPCKSHRRQHVFLCDSLGCASLIGDESGKNARGHKNTRRKQNNITGDLSKQGTHFLSFQSGHSIALNYNKLSQIQASRQAKSMKPQMPAEGCAWSPEVKDLWTVEGETQGMHKKSFTKLCSENTAFL